MIPDLLTAAWTAAVLAAGAVLAWRSSGPASDPLDPTTPGRAFVLGHLSLVGIGSVLLILGGESDGAGPSLAAYGLLAFGVGSWLAARRWGVPTELPRGVTVDGLRPIPVAAMALVGLVALGTLIAQSGLPMLSADAQTSRAGFSGLTFDLFRWFVPPAALAALAIALAERGRLRWAVAVAALGGVLLLMLALASRALPLELTIEALLICWWAGRRLPRRAWAALAVVALVVFAGVQVLRIGERGSLAGPADAAVFVAERTVNRIVLIQPRTLELLASAIPSEEPYFAGATYVRRLVVLSGGAPRSLGTWIYEKLFPTQTPPGFASPGVLGEAWANAGPFLALPILFALGLVSQALGRLLARSGTGSADRVLAALVVMAVARTYATSLNGFLATLLAALVWRLIAAPLPWRSYLPTGANQAAQRARTASSRSA